jgi:hypothetical protein
MAYYTPAKREANRVRYSKSLLTGLGTQNNEAKIAQNNSSLYIAFGHIEKLAGLRLSADRPVPPGENLYLSFERCLS